VAHFRETFVSVMLCIDKPPFVAIARAFASTLPSGDRDSANQIAREPQQPDMKIQIASVRSGDNLNLHEEQPVPITRISGLIRKRSLVMGRAARSSSLPLPKLRVRHPVYAAFEPPFGHIFELSHRPSSAAFANP
jgi:hypothetical protein